jgi:hypothetical protein
MSPVTSKSKTMKITQIREKAKGLGIDPGNMKKTELIHAIQRAEGNTPCYGTAQGWCQYEDCCFRGDCLR